MKRFACILFFALLSHASFAKCGGVHISIYPKTKTISNQPIIILELYYLGPEVLDQDGKTYPVYLQSGSERVNLNVAEILVGEMNISQVVLKPAELLKTGKSYELVLDIGKRKFNIDKARWLVEEANNDTLLKWNNPPRYTTTTYQKLGCGPVNYVNFSCDLPEKSGLVRTTVKNMATGKEVSFYLFTGNDTLSVGHGMCTGPFYFTKDSRYEVAFQLYDWNGTARSEQSPIYSFTSPTPTNR